MSALEIMQACLDYYKKNSDKQDTASMAGHYLIKIENVINGETEEFTSNDFFEIHRFVISIFSGKLVNGKVVNSHWSDKQWDNVLKQIEKCYEKDESYAVIKMIK